MGSDDAFQDLIRRVRAGDPRAAEELVRGYEPYVRRTVRLRLTDGRLRAAFDSMDVCQSVMGSFFVRAAAGAYDLNSPAQLLQLLVTMARNKLAGQVRRERAARRDRGRLDGGIEADRVAALCPSPSDQVAAEELLRRSYELLTAEERHLYDLRNQGWDWDAIAADLGDNAAAVRKRLSRALDRVVTALGLEESDHA